MAMVLFCQCGSDKVDVDKWDNQRMLLKFQKRNPADREKLLRERFDRKRAERR
jgi:hypothetical protein